MFPSRKLLRIKESEPIQVTLDKRPVYQPWMLRALIVLLLAAAYTGFTLFYSYRFGRLALYPTFDDVGYFDDALHRLETFYTAGPATVLKMYGLQPPHAPYSTIVAFFAFAIFGAHDWAPYATNILLILGYFGFADYLLKGVALWQKLLVFALLASFPLLSWSVQEFRADHASALMLTICVIMILKRPWVNSPRRHQVSAGIWGGLAIVSKPHTIVGAMLVIGAALVLASLCDWIGQRLRASKGRIISAWIACLLPVFLLPLPHFLVAWRDIYSYIYDNVYGRYKDIWQTKKSLLSQLFYYITGDGAQSMFGGRINPQSPLPPPYVPGHLQIIAFVLLIACARLLWRRRRPELARAAAFSLLLLGSFLIPTLMRTKSPYFGLGFDTLLLFYMVLALRDLLLDERLHRERFAGRALPIASALLFCLSGLGALAWGFPMKVGDRAAPWMQNRREIVYGLYHAIRDNPDFVQPVVYVPVEGDVNYAVLRYLACQEDRDVLPYGTPIHTDNTNYAKSQFDIANFVIAGDQGNGLIADFLPESKIQGQIVQLLKARQDYALVGQYSFHRDDKSFYLFEHIGDFFGWQPGDGWGFLEPYNQPDAPLVRWGYGPSSTIHFTTPNAGKYEIQWRARTIFHGQQVTVNLDGRQIGARTIQAGNTFQSAGFPIDLAAGPHTIELNYQFWEQVQPRPTAVIFSRLRILGVNNGAR